MLTSQYLRRQAALCLRIAAAAADQRVATEYVLMAEEFSVKADEIDPSLNSIGKVALDMSRVGSHL